MKVLHEWLKDYIGETIPSPEKIEELLTFHSFEIEGVETVGDSHVIDVDVLPNRSSDCLCHRGIAREIATLMDTTLINDPLQKPLTLPSIENVHVTIEDTTACPRFTATVLRNVTVGESPEWLKKRLEALGQRSINNIVDATNYVMYALGQPLHAYDADRFPHEGDTWHFGVRFAREGETIDLIAEGGKTEDRTVTLEGNELLIVETKSDTPVGLAGVKGGNFAGVHAGTKNIIVEAAHFDPALTRKTARKLGIVIDASKRFENEPSRELPPYAQEEIVKLIQDIAGGTCDGIVDIYPEPLKPIHVPVTLARTNALLGLSLTHEEMIAILERVGCTVTKTDEGCIAVGPWERTDLCIEEDFIEEVGRVYGYTHVESVVPDSVELIEINARHYYSDRIRTLLCAQGFSEVITSSFRKKDQVQLANALASDKSYVRSSLIPNLEEVLDKNSSFLDLIGSDAVRVFELGTVFKKTETDVVEHIALGIGVRNKVSGYTPKDDETVKEIIAHLATELGTDIVSVPDHGISEVNVTELLKTLPVPEAYDPIPEVRDVAYQPFSMYPHTSRDVALWVPETTSISDVEAVLNEHAGPLRVKTTLFDEFTKDGRISYAFRLVFQSNDKTLTDEEVNEVMLTLRNATDARGWETR